MPVDNTYFENLLNQVKTYLKPERAPHPSVPKTSFKTDLGGKAGPFQSPVPGAKNSGDFDPTGNGNVGRKHLGLDLRAPGGTAIYPIASGIVSKVQPDPLGGNTVVIEHAGNYKSYYAHCGTIKVQPGDKVNLQTQIATVGDSGNAKGFSHLHLQVWRNGSLIDPRSVFSFEKQTVFNKETEKLWLPGAKEVAKNFNIKDHLNDKKPATRVACRLDRLETKIDLYYSLISR